MLSDALLNLANATSLNTGGAGSYVIGKQYDLGLDARGIGSLVGASQLFLVITATVAADSAGDAATASFSLLTDDDPAMGSPTVVATTAVLAQATITPGAILAVIPIPQGYPWLRYIGLRQTTAVEAFTAGKISATIVDTVPNGFAYPQGAGADLGA